MLNNETTFQKISRKSGMKPVNCKCNVCKSQCVAPCRGTPEDMLAIIEAGHADRLVRKEVQDFLIIEPGFDVEKKSCTFFTNGLCELHDAGLKPTCGKLSHHSVTNEWFRHHKPINYFVMKEWEQIPEGLIDEMQDALNLVKKITL